MAANILSVFERFAFSILPYGIDIARTAIARQAASWGRDLICDESVARDVRSVYLSPDGPDKPPAVRTGILLSEVTRGADKRTLFVSNVADGYQSMVYMLSRSTPGTHLSIEVSRMDILYPRNALTANEDGETTRVVYSMRDSSRWEFFERGRPLSIEDTQHYLARKKNDRLTPDIIAGYLTNYGSGSLDADAWISEETNAVLLRDAGFRLWSE